MIGVFDSGLGGLTVLKELIKTLPQYSYVYLGDNARAPYGDKNDEEIFNYTKKAVDFLFNNDCKIIIIACNTVSSKALRRIQQEYLPVKHKNKRVLGVIIPVAEKMTNIKDIYVGLIGTKATISSKTYEKEIKKTNNNIKIIKKACPLLVPLVEKNAPQKEIKKILIKYLIKFKNQKINSLILGCTHYPVLEKEIKSILKTTKIFNSPKIVAKSLKKYFKKHKEIEEKLVRKSKVLFLTTGREESFKILGEKFLGKKIEKVKRIKI